MKITRNAVISIAQTLYSAIIAVGVSYLIGFATQSNLLLVAALPLGVALVCALAWLPARAQLFAWSATTAWLLSSVYLGVSEIEWLMLFAVMLAAVAGAFWSPWFLAAIWFLHPLWDLLPRELPAHQHDLPLACLIYDLVVALYLIWRIRKGFFKDAIIKGNSGSYWLSQGWTRALVALLIGVIVAIEISWVAFVSMDELSVVYAAVTAAGLLLATNWLPVQAKRAFWVVFTVWTGMSFAHSGEVLELAVFALMIALAVLGLKVSANYWAIAWLFHAFWNFIPRAHDMTGSSALMGHWMEPVAGFLFEALLAVYILVMTMRNKLGRCELQAQHS